MLLKACLFFKVKITGCVHIISLVKKKRQPQRAIYLGTGWIWIGIDYLLPNLIFPIGGEQVNMKCSASYSTDYKTTELRPVANHLSQVLTDAT